MALIPHHYLRLDRWNALLRDEHVVAHAKDATLEPLMMWPQKGNTATATDFTLFIIHAWIGAAVCDRQRSQEDL